MMSSAFFAHIAPIASHAAIDSIGSCKILDNANAIVKYTQANIAEMTILWNMFFMFFHQCFSSSGLKNKSDANVDVLVIVSKTAVCQDVLDDEDLKMIYCMNRFFIDASKSLGWLVSRNWADVLD